MDEIEIEIAKLEKYIKSARSAGACIGIFIVIYGNYFFNTLEYQIYIIGIAIFLIWVLMLSSFRCQNKLEKLEENSKINKLNQFKK